VRERERERGAAGFEWEEGEIEAAVPDV